MADGKEISASELSNLSYSPVAGEYGNNYARYFIIVHDGTTYSDQVGTMTIGVSKRSLGLIVQPVYAASTRGQSYDLLAASTGDNNINDIMTGARWNIKWQFRWNLSDL